MSYARYVVSFQFPLQSTLSHSTAFVKHNKNFGTHVTYGYYVSTMGAPCVRCIDIVTYHIIKEKSRVQFHNIIEEELVMCYVPSSKLHAYCIHIYYLYFPLEYNAEQRPTILYGVGVWDRTEYKHITQMFRIINDDYEIFRFLITTLSQST